MWIWMTICSAMLLGVYDVAKKSALAKNGVFYVLIGATALTSLFLSPFLKAGCPEDHIRLVFKAVLVTTSWVSGMQGMKLLPLTTVSTIKASRPVFVVVFSIILFGERLNLLQWVGVALVFAALWMLTTTSGREGMGMKSNKGFAWMWISVLSGAASALYDKHIMASMEPLFVQSWTNVYITVLLAGCILFKAFVRSEREKFRWDWTIVLIAVLITAADALYFFSLKDERALLSVISLVRRCSVVVTFVFGAWLFKEHNIRDKAISLVILMGGVTLLMAASY